MSRQKAPSTRRCIKTLLLKQDRIEVVVRKHSAPQGALRLKLLIRTNDFPLIVRKHPAPEGALRLDVSTLTDLLPTVRKHPAPEGALRLVQRHARHARLTVRKHPAPEDTSRHSLPVASRSPAAGPLSPDGPTEEAGRVDSHSRERRPFGLTSSEAGG